MASCEARILGAAFEMPGTCETAHRTAQCPDKATKKITVDNGDATMSICDGCMARFRTKGLSAPKDLWLGWFDCAYPAGTRLESSPWYYAQLEAQWGKRSPAEYRQLWKVYEERLAAAVSEASSQEEEDEPIGAPRLGHSALAATEPEPPKSKKQVLEEELEAALAWVKVQDRCKTTKEMLAAHRKIIQLRKDIMLCA